MKAVRKFQQTQSTNWVFTLNNYSEDEMIEVSSLPYDPSPFLKSDALVKAVAFSAEVGERNGTPHLQGYLQTSKKGIKKHFLRSKK